MLILTEDYFCDYWQNVLNLHDNSYI